MTQETDTVPYREPDILFPEQWARLITTWKNMAGLKTADAVREHLGISTAEFIEASRGYEIPRSWLEKTANELQIDVTYILTGQTDTDASVNKGATGTKIN